MEGMETVDILGVNINKLNMELAVKTAEGFLDSDGFHCIYTPNSEIVMSAYKNEEFRDIINKADLRTADGIGLVHAAKILGSPLEERVAGFDLVMKILEDLPKLGKSVYFFGSAPGVADEAKAKLEEKFPGINVCGTANGYFDAEREKEVIEEINSLKPDLLFVCLGAPKQEKWLHAHIDELDVGVAFGLGGSLDVFAGTVKRAPEFFQKHGIEWLYRLMKQPKRAIRMLDLPRFALKVILKGRKFPQE